MKILRNILGHGFPALWILKKSGNVLGFRVRKKSKLKTMSCPFHWRATQGSGKSTPFEEVKERIGLNDEYEEYAIHDYELPFEIDEYTPIEEVNRLCEMVEDLPEYIQEELSELQSYFGSIEELCEHEDDIICHSGCDDMADVARCYLEESGQLGELPAHLQNYIDYAAYGRDMELEGTFVVTNHGVYEILR